MKDIVVHILDSVCDKHNRNPDGSALIEAARTFGTVEPLDSAIASERAKWQAEINQLKINHEAECTELRQRLASIEEKEVTEEELEILRLIRKKSAREAAGYQKDIKSRDDMLIATKAEYEAKVSQIATFLGL